MIFSKAYAQAISPDNVAMANVPSTGEAFMTNILMVLVLVCLFYFLMIRPQQKRFKQHKVMLDALKKGDKVVTGGGLIGKIKKLSADEVEVVVDLGNGHEVTALRSTLNKHQDIVATPAKK